jgi:hypothetical protein
MIAALAHGATNSCKRGHVRSLKAVRALGVATRPVSLTARAVNVASYTGLLQWERGDYGYGLKTCLKLPTP